MPRPAQVPAPLEADDLTAIGRGLVESARSLADPTLERPADSRRLFDLHATLRSIRELQRIHESAKRSVRADEMHRVRLATARAQSDAARARRGTAIAYYRRALSAEKRDPIHKRLLEKRAELADATIEHKRASTENVRTRTRLAVERFEAEYPPVSDTNGATQDSRARHLQDVRRETPEQYLEALRESANSQPALGEPRLDPEPNRVLDPPGDRAGQDEPNSGGDGTRASSGDGGAA